MDRGKKLEFRTRLEIPALPAAVNTLFLAADTNLTERWPPARPAALIASESNHGAEDLVACIIVLESFPERIIGYGVCEFLILGGSKLLSQVPGKIRDFLLVPMAVPAVQTAVCNQACFLVQSVQLYSASNQFCV